MALVTVSFWGKGEVPPEIRVQVRAGETLSASILRRLRRDLGVTFAGGPRVDSTRVEDGATIMQATLGRACVGGGYTPTAEVWWAAPKGAG